MKKKMGYTVFSLLLLTMLMTGFVPKASAEEGKFELKANATMREVLAERTGKRAILRMQSGEDLEGTVVLVGNGLVHISKLAGKDFYDAVVNIDRISAVLVKARDH